MTHRHKFTLALFYCQNTPGSGEQERQALEMEYGGSLRLFPLPCSGRMEPLHFLRALEGWADAACLVACPEGACRYFEGNRRAKKRVERTKEILAAVGLETERAALVIQSGETPKTLAVLAAEIMEKVSGLGPSSVRKPGAKRESRDRKGR